MALGLMATVAITAHLVNTVRPPAIGDRVSAGFEASPLTPASMVPPTKPSAGLIGPALPPNLRSGEVAAVRPWFTQGRWWSIFAVPGDGYHLFALAGPKGPWVDTQVLVDDRTDAKVDVAVSGTQLVVTTVGTRSYRRDAARVSRFSWNDTRRIWVLDPDFPIQVSDAGIPGGVQVAVTDDGQIWLTRLQDGRVLLAHLYADGSSFAPFAPIPGDIASSDVGAYALVADRDLLHLVWRSATRDQLSLASRHDGSWTVIDHTLWGAAGDGQLDAAAAGPARPGVVFVLVPTSLGQRTSNERAPSVVLVEMSPLGSREAVVGVQADRLTRPLLVLDLNRERVSVVAAVAPQRSEAGHAQEPWTFTEKHASFTRPAFGPGSGDVLATSPHVAPRSFVAGASQEPGSGLVVAAIDPDRRSWITAQHGGESSQETTSVSSSSLVHDSFEAFPPGDPGPAAWYRQEQGPRSVMIAADGDGRSLAVVTDLGAQRTTVCRALPAWGSAAVTIRTEIRATGTGTADARLLTVRGPKGPLVAIRRSSKGMVGHMTSGGRVDDLLLPDGSALVVTVRIRPDASTAEVRLDVVDTADTTTLTIPYLSPFVAGRGRLCVSPAIGDPTARLEIADLEVTR